MQPVTTQYSFTKGSFQVKSGRTFFILSVPLSYDHYFKSYHCISCGKNFISKNGASRHICTDNYKKNVKVEKFIPNHAAALQYLLRFIAISNIHMHAVELDALTKSYQSLDPSFTIPKEDKLHDLMIALANNINDEINF